MRSIALAVAALVVGLAPAHAAWKTYKYPQYGFAVDFPSEPKTSKGEYAGTVAGKVPTTIISAQDGDITYQIVIADFTKRLIDTPTILEEAVFLETVGNKLVSDVGARTDTDVTYAKYGRRVTVLTKDGGKRIAEIYLVGGRLLNFQGVISPKGDLGDPGTARFQDSIVFDTKRDWNIPPARPRVVPAEEQAVPAAGHAGAATK